MKCSKCGEVNDTNNKFCVNCGEKLSSTVFCSCGNPNNKNNKFCVFCGNSLMEFNNAYNVNSKKTKEKRKNSVGKKVKLLDFYSEWKLLSVLILSSVIITFIIIKNRDSQEQLFNQSSKTENYIPKPQVLIGSRDYVIASKFICSCGSCNEESLETCECPTAKEERTFIATQIKAGFTNAEIEKNVEQKYGWLKPQFKSANKQNVVQSNKPATIADMNLITDNFKCPCGKCGMDDLTKCNCNHKNGAQEVKAFIQDKITMQKYSLIEIIDLVENNYGSRKRS